MRTIIGAALIAATLSPLPALAQRSSDDARYQQQLDQYHHDRREWREQVRDTNQYNRRTQRDWRRYNRYDYNRPEPGQQYYYADRYYRQGNYPVRRLGRNDRVYRGYNGQYYCRRSDGTTGLIIGGLAGGVLGSAIDNGRSSILGTLIGAGAGAALGSSIDRGNVRCR